MDGGILRKDLLYNIPRYVPQDVQGYMNEAGEDWFRNRLDELFTVELPDDIPGAHDIQGRIGAYWRWE